MLRRIVGTTLVSLLAPLVMASVRPVRDAVVISVKHDAALNVTFTANGVATTVSNRALTGIAGQDDFAVNHDSDVEVILENPNELLYHYKLDKKEQPAPSKVVFDQFGSTVDALSKALAGAVKTNPDAQLKSISDRMTIEAANKNEKPPRTCRQAYEDLNKVLTVANAVWKRLADIEKLIRLSASDPRNVRTTVLSTDEWDIGSLRDTFEDSAKTIDEQLLAHTEDQTDDDDADPVGNGCETLFTLAVAKESEIREGLDKLEEFQNAVRKLDVPLSLGTFSVTRTEFTIVGIHVEKNEDNWPKDLKNAKFVGDRTVKVFPDERVPVSLQASMVYSFVEASDFGTEAIPAGGEETGFRITEKHKEKTGFDLAAGLEFAPNALDFSSFNTVIQLGISPSDHLGVFLGFGIKPAEKFAFGAGIAFHQVDVLGDGQVVGGVLAKEDDLKVDKKFRSGPYVFFSYKPK